MGAWSAGPPTWRSGARGNISGLQKLRPVRLCSATKSTRPVRGRLKPVPPIWSARTPACGPSSNGSARPTDFFLKIAFLVDRPTPFKAPFYRFPHREPEHEFRVLFTGRDVAEPVFDPELGVPVAWGIDLLGG